MITSLNGRRSVVGLGLAAMLAALAGCGSGGGSDATARDYLKKLYANVPVLDTGARAALTTFAQRGVGDVFVSWENEAFLALDEFGDDKYEVVIPSVSILAEPSVAVVDQVAIRHGTRTVAEEYLKYLYSKEGQEIIARNYYRPRDADVAAKYADRFPEIRLVTVQELGGWAEVQKTHFADGGLFDGLLVRKP